jgi:hypothetical protein
MRGVPIPIDENRKIAAPVPNNVRMATRRCRPARSAGAGKTAGSRSDGSAWIAGANPSPPTRRTLADLVIDKKWDGTGYPNGLAGEEIDVNPRILAMADTFAAITSDRPYRKGREPAVAVEGHHDNQFFVVHFQGADGTRFRREIVLDETGVSLHFKSQPGVVWTRLAI